MLSQGLYEVEVGGTDDILAIFDEGTVNRRKAPHELNQDSSRSHSLFTLHLITKGIDAELGTPVRAVVDRN